MGQASASSEAPSAEVIAQLKERLADQWWRLNNLYYIVDKNGDKVKFKPNEAQERLYRGKWNRNIILKARQLGFTTFVMIYMLDVTLFNSNISCAVIAHGRQEASDLFQKKILYAYNNLPEFLRKLRPTATLTKGEIRFNNDSGIIVGTSARSGTFQILHVSEFGKICRKYPEKATEIVTGSLPAVPMNGIVFIESTAEGRYGYFFDFAELARKMMIAGSRLTKQDFKFFFFPWWSMRSYALDDEDARDTVIPARISERFDELEDKYGIELTRNQLAWYVKEEALYGDKIKREHPSIAEEAFEQVVEGAYFGQQFTRIYAENRITSVPHQPQLVVDTWWDLGMSDSTVIWFTQTVGRQIHVIDYYENSGEGLAHYCQVVNSKPYRYGKHTGPHDLNVRELGTGVSRLKTAANHGIKFVAAPQTDSKQEDIEAVRLALDICWFDAAKCEKGLAALESYTKDWNAALGCWRDTPRHDWASHSADGFMVMATSHPIFYVDRSRRPVVRGETVSSARTRG